MFYINHEYMGILQCERKKAYLFPNWFFKVASFSLLPLSPSFSPSLSLSLYFPPLFFVSLSFPLYHSPYLFTSRSLPPSFSLIYLSSSVSLSLSLSLSLFTTLSLSLTIIFVLSFFFIISFPSLESLTCQYVD